MSRYSVTLPIAGFTFFSGIEANSPEEAIDKALELPIEPINMNEVNSYKELVSGNVCNADIVEAEAEEEDEDESEDE